MVIDGSLIAFLLAMPFLAALGLTALAAFIIMPVLGLVSEWSFRRIFFTSFLIGLLAPIIAAVSLAPSVERLMGDRDFRQVIEQTVPGGNWEGVIPQIEEIGDQVERGEITEEEARDRLEAIVQERSGFRVNLDDVEFSNEGDNLQISIE